MIIIVVAIAIVVSSSSMSAGMWALRQTPNPPPADAQPDAGGEAAADTQAPAPRVYVTAGPNVPQDWTGGKITYGKCEGAECSACPAGSMKVAAACKGWTVKDKKSCWNPMTNTFSKPVCSKKDGCAAGQAGVVTAAGISGATGPACPIGSKPVDNNDKACINPQSMQISGLSNLEDIKAYRAAMKGGAKAMQAFFAKKNPDGTC